MLRGHGATPGRCCDSIRRTRPTRASGGRQHARSTVLHDAPEPGAARGDVIVEAAAFSLNGARCGCWGVRVDGRVRAGIRRHPAVRRRAGPTAGPGWSASSRAGPGQGGCWHAWTAELLRTLRSRRRRRPAATAADRTAHLLAEASDPSGRWAPGDGASGGSRPLRHRVAHWLVCTLTASVSGKLGAAAGRDQSAPTRSCLIAQLDGLL